MSWKAIGRSVTGTSHHRIGKGCEDAVCYDAADELLLCCVSDGAGSASHAAYAAEFTVAHCVASLKAHAQQGLPLDEAAVYAALESVYDGLQAKALEEGVALNEFSCTLLGCAVLPERALFFQIGDGAIVRNDGTGFFTPVWPPQQGEYLNTTSFLVDDPGFRQLQCLSLDVVLDELALFSDGLQMLVLNLEAGSVHQPFLNRLFPALRQADTPEKQELLGRRLEEYLDSDMINLRTDDDKTLFLATRMPHAV